MNQPEQKRELKQKRWALPTLQGFALLTASSRVLGF